MVELVLGADYPARRNGQIAVSMNPETKSLMVYIPFALCGIEFAGTQSICIGTKDGTLQEVALQNLHDIFNWQTENPFDLQRMAQPESQDAEFTLAECFLDSYTPKGKTDAIQSYKFRWLNKLGSGAKVSTDDEESAAMEVWGEKFSSALSTPKPEKKAEAKKEEKPAVKTSARKLPARTVATAVTKEARKETCDSVTDLLAKREGKNVDDQDEMNELGNNILFPACDKLFGTWDGKTLTKSGFAETPEQWGQVADELGL